MKRGPLYRTIKRDLTILAVFDAGDLAPKEIVGKLRLENVFVVYHAIERRRRFPKFYAEQLCESMENGNVAKTRSTA